MTDIKTKVSELNLVSAGNPLPLTGTNIRLYVQDQSQSLADRDRQIHKRDLLRALFQSGSEMGDSVLVGLTSAQREGVLEELGLTYTPRLWLPAISWSARASDGASPDAVEGSDTTPDVAIFEFANESSDYQGIEMSLVLPPRWNRGTLKFRVYWTSGNTGTCRWGVKGCAASDSDSLRPTFGGEVAINDAVTAVNEVMITSLSGSLTLAGNPQDNDVLYLRTSRRSDNSGDTVNGAVRFIGMMLEWGVDY